MTSNAISLPDDTKLCHEIISQQHEQLVTSQQKIQQLEYRLSVLLRQMYGRRSERLFDPNQLALFDIATDEAAPVAEESPVAETQPNNKPASKKKPGHGRRKFPENLERREILLDIPEEEKACPCCGKQRTEISRTVTERLGFDPARFYVNEYVQPKYACTCGKSGVATAEKPIQPIEKGSAEPELVAFVGVSRFDDHSPYYRQENGHFRRANIDIARSTLSDWMRQVADLVWPLYELMHDRVLLSKMLGTDDTPSPVLVPGRGSTQEARFWLYRGDKVYPYNVFDFSMDRKQIWPIKFLRRDEHSKPGKGFRGFLQADAYAGYDVLFRMGGIVEVGCWAHARRKFFDAKETDLARGMESLARIKLLYEVEEAARDLPSADRLSLRQERSVPLLASLRTWLDEHYGKVLPKSPMGEAINYALSNWKAFERYTTDGDIPIDNNAVEREQKLIALGRKNWLFAGSERGGKTAAVLFSIISSAKRHGLNTWAYLRDLLVRLADLKPGELETLLPDRWQDSHAR